MLSAGLLVRVVIDHHLYAVMPTTLRVAGDASIEVVPKEEFAVRCRSAKDCSLTVCNCQSPCLVDQGSQGLGALLEVNNGITVLQVWRHQRPW